MRIELKRGTDQIIRLPRLRTAQVPPVYLNAATVRATLRDSMGQPVAGYQSLLMAYVLESEGTYTLEIDGVTFMVLAGLYTLEVRARQDEKDYRVVCDVTITD